ncbi:hypothetical protein CGK40_24460 [Vibrio parahaemolyticus]|nr:hypothetical protein CGK40_24460 [Vibrio parahaemolyticus]
MLRDVAACVRYYNLDRLHSANDDLSPIEFENSITKVSGWTRPVQCSLTITWSVHITKRRNGIPLYRFTPLVAIAHLMKVSTLIRCI